MPKIRYMEEKMRYIMLLSIFTLQLILTGCGGGGTTSAEDSDAPVRLSMQTDNSRSIASKATGTCLEFGNIDEPGVADGLDCDVDGGTVAYLDAKNFKIAIKRLAFRNSDGDLIDIIADAGTLAASLVYDLSTPIALADVDIPIDTYTGYYMEVYYIDMNFPINTALNEKDIRIYMSDDDFAAEGTLGNHQGDVLMRAADTVLRFVAGGLPWIDGNLLNARGATEGAGGTDAETGHKRGLYGDTGLWNDADFNQGALTDIFFISENLPGSVPLTTAGLSVTITFDLAETWFFEDFNADGNFEPCNAGPANIEACAGTAAWSPVFPTINLTIS